MLDWLFDPVKNSKPYWLELLPIVITIALAVTGYWMAFRNWKKQKREELRILANQHREAARIAACKAVWALLAYFSEKEHSRTVFVQREDGQQTNWFLRCAQAQDYLKAVEEVFFTQGHGIFMPPAIRDGMYEFRSRVYRILEHSRRQGNSDDELIVVKNPEVIAKIQELREKLRQDLRAESAYKFDDVS
ncbi:MAG: CRISPR-associated protein Csx28 [Saprospiraceae bacterium]